MLPSSYKNITEKLIVQSYRHAEPSPACHRLNTLTLHLINLWHCPFELRVDAYLWLATDYISTSRSMSSCVFKTRITNICPVSFNRWDFLSADSGKHWKGHKIHTWIPFTWHCYHCAHQLPVCSMSARCDVSLSTIVYLLQPATDPCILALRDNSGTVYYLMTSSLPHHSQCFAKNWKLIYFVIIPRHCF